MQDTPRQMVLPFLADDPLYIREIREEKVVAEVKAALEPVLHDKMVDILHDILVRCRDCHDPADWWKRGADPDEDEDNPL